MRKMELLVASEQWSSAIQQYELCQRALHEELDYLRGKQLLLVMDNYEHLLAGAGVVDEILQQAAGVKVLATSRQRLNFQSEHLFELEGLPYTQQPASDLHAPADPALRLFLDRMAQVKHLAPDEENLAQIQHICELVEGFPLGIELAAALVRVMPLTEIIAELAASFDVLATTLHDVPARHRSLRAVFESSWERLGTEERQVLARLAIFRGGFDRRAAQVVARSTIGELASLVDKSLLRLNLATPQSAGRYELHELLRKYAAERMSDHEEIAALHAHYFAEFVYTRKDALRGGRQKQALLEIGREIENVRVAWNYNGFGK